MKSLFFLAGLFLLGIAVADGRAGGVAPANAYGTEKGSAAGESLDRPPAPAPASSPERVIDTPPAKAKVPAPPAKAKVPALPARKTDSAAPADGKQAPPPLDLQSLERQLRETRAIGLFTKIALKNQVDDLVSQFREYHRKPEKTELAGLRQRYDMLLLKLLSLLQDSDPPLAHTIVASRDILWGLLTDPVKFTAI